MIKRRKIIKFIAGLAIGLTIAFITAVGCLLAWVGTGPRPVYRFSPIIEQAFHAEAAPYSLNIEQTWLVWGDWRHPIDVRLRNVKVLTEQGQIFASFPEILVGLDLFSLPFGRVLPRSITIVHPIISLFQNEDHSLNFGFSQQPITLPSDESTPTPSAEELANTASFAAVLDPLLSPEKHRGLSQLRFISIQDADVGIRNQRTGAFFQATGVGFSAKRDYGNDVKLAISGSLLYSHFKSPISAQFSLNKDRATIEGNVAFEGLEPSRLASFFTHNAAFAMIHLPLSGNASVVLGKTGALERMQFIVESGIGEIRSEYLTEALPVNWSHIEGQISNNAGDIQIDDMRANIAEMLLTGNGIISLNNDDAAIRANVAMKVIPVAKIPLVWPPKMSPESRQWVTTNITEGVIPEATARINIQFGDLKQPVLPKEAIDANISLQDAKIRYLPDHPEIMHVLGNVHIDGLSLDAALTSGSYMKDTKLSNGHVIIDDLNADNPYIKVNFDTETSAKDVVRVLGLPRLKHAQKLNLKVDEVEGTVKGSGSLGFHFFAPQGTEPDVDLIVNAQVSGLGQNGFLNKFDVKNAEGNFTINNAALEYQGKGEVNGANVSSVGVKYLFKPEKGLDTFIDIKSATAPVESLRRFGYPAFPFLAGTLGVKANLKQGSNLEFSTATLDLTGASVHARAIGWDKPDKEPASLDLSAEKRENVVTITSLHLKGNNIDAKGSAALNKNLTAIESLTLDKCVLGITNLNRVYYQTIPGGYKIEASGKSADLSGWMQHADGEPSTFSFEHFPALQLKADIDQAVFGKNRTVSNLKAAMSCGSEICDSADVTGITGPGKNFNFKILRNPKGQRQVSLHAEDAGAFLKDFDVYDNMEGGDIVLTGTYDNSKNSTLRGRFDIRNYTLRDAPVLAKILSLASLTGFFDTLQGKGIAFDRVSVPFVLQDDVITVAKAKMHGPAIGMTGDGTITMPGTIYNLQGTVVPSYTLNSMAGKVPLVGQLLTGGDGQGVFAARYSVTGNEKDPKVTVNPLSILTPGFLRGLFDVMDKPPPKGEGD